MADKKKTPEKKKRNVAKPPTLEEKITDFSTGSMKNIRFIPKKSK